MSDFRFRAILLPSFALTLAFLCPSSSHAQQAFAPASVPANTTAQSPESLSWIPDGMAALRQQTTSHTDFTFDRSVLGLVGNMSTLDEPTRSSIARLNGIALHIYRFPATTGYDPSTVEAIRAQYGALGWKHFSTTHQQPGPISVSTGRTDVWLDMHGINLAGAAILVAGPTSVNLVAVSGNLSTLDLLHLRGHFGIPQFPDDALPH